VPTTTTSGRREAILEAALSAFLEHGVANAPIEAVCAGSRASVGSVYHHFGDKAGLAAAVYSEALAAYQATFLQALRGCPEDAEHSVKAVVRAHVRWCLQDEPRRARYLLFHGDAARGEDLGDLNAAFFAEVLRWWRPHVHYGAVRDLDLDLAYALWLGPAQEYCRLRLAGRTAVPPRRAVPELASAAWQSLKRGET
jgi:AcrR family transcriptional regulator